MNTEATSMASKSVNSKSGFQKSLQLNGEVHPSLIYVD